MVFGSNVSDVSGSSSSSSSSNGNSNSSSSRIESLASKTHNDLQPGPAERQEIKIDMMLVGINGESILRQRNTWRETLLRLTKYCKTNGIDISCCTKWCRLIARER